MQHVMDVWHVDAKRIHFDGYSMGGWMTWRMLCAHSDILASVAPIAAGTANPGCFTGSEPAKKIPILYTHGRNDGLVQYATATPQRDAVLAAWYPGVTPVVLGKDTDYEWDRWTSPEGNVFEFIQHDWECRFTLATLALKGHCFPGNDQFLGCDQPFPDGGLPPGAAHQMDWGKTVLQFFVDHPMK
jgi:poly(3-hydroxybutyrate) depolymerase